MNNDKNGNFKYWTIIILLIIIILLLLFFTRFGKIQNQYMLIPTGNVDVFDIDINCNCSFDKCEYVDNDGNEIPVFDPENNKPKYGEVYVDDKNGNFVYQQNLKIFNNSAFHYLDKIAPGIANTYNFIIHNSTPSELKYYLEMNEESEFFINLRYRLRRNDSYVIGDDNNWVTSSELKTEFKNIKSLVSDKYSLDWKWLYEDDKDNLDTFAGENMTSKYKLNIRFYFEEVVKNTEG